MKSELFFRSLASVTLALAITPAAQGQIFVAEGGLSRVGKYDAATGATINANYVTGLNNGASGFALDSSNHIFVVSNDDNSVGEYNATTGAPINTTFITGLNGPRGLALDPTSNHIFVANVIANTVGEYDAATGATINANFITALNGPYGLALDSNNHLFVTNNGVDTVGEYNATTGAAVNASFITGAQFPECLQLDALNHMFLTYGNTTIGGTVGEYDAATGAAINTSFVTGLNYTFGLALDDSNHLFVTSLANVDRVGEYDATNGAVVNANFITGLSGPTFIAVAAVPEPSTLVLAALGGLALLAYRKRRLESRLMNRIFAPLCLCCTISLFASPASAVTIAWVPVGDPGNAPDPATGDQYGAVRYSYSIDKYDVTNSQYAEFLNAKDPNGTNLLGLYDSKMGDPSTALPFSGHGGIAFTPGNPAGSMYSAISSNANHPVNYVTWYNAIRFANWLNNGQGNGDTETGAYTLGPLDPGGGGVPANGNSITRNPGARIFLISQDEWYKAAYYDPRTTAHGGPPGDSHYWLYPTANNTAPTAEIPPGGSNSANFNGVIGTVGDLTNVGAYTGTTSHYGAFDMGGNLFQMNETFLPALFGREVLGGDWFGGSVGMESTFIGNVAITPFLGSIGTGFRVASIGSVPEPSTGLLAVVACGVMWVLRKRFNQR